MRQLDSIGRQGLIIEAVNELSPVRKQRLAPHQGNSNEHGRSQAPNSELLPHCRSAPLTDQVHPYLNFICACDCAWRAGNSLQAGLRLLNLHMRFVWARFLLRLRCATAAPPKLPGDVTDRHVDYPCPCGYIRCHDPPCSCLNACIHAPFVHMCCDNPNIPFDDRRSVHMRSSPFAD